MSITYQNLDVVSVEVGCSGWQHKNGFFHIHLKDGKIIRFNEYDKKELELLKTLFSEKKIGIRKKRKYYYIENIIDTDISNVNG